MFLGALENPGASNKQEKKEKNSLFNRKLWQDQAHMGGGGAPADG